MKLRFLHPRVFGTAVALVTLSIGALTLILADFGAPPWVFLILCAWLGTIGLPTTVVVKKSNARVMAEQDGLA